MNRLLLLSPRKAYVGFVILNILCVGMGMGVPIFCIFLGFFVGWYIVKSLATTSESIEIILIRFLPRAIWTSAFTFLLMGVLWGPAVTRLLDPTVDHATFGIPMILYQPIPSFIGWLILMTVVSPFLQFLTILFGAHLALYGVIRKHRGSNPVAGQAL